MSSDSFLDHLSSRERQKLRKMMSPEAYERLREKVKGPEDLAEELKRQEMYAELRFHLETEPEIYEKLQNQIEKDLREQGAEQMVEATGLSPEQKAALEQKNFRITVSSHPMTHQDQIMLLPEGTVQEAIPLTMSLSDKYASQFVKKDHHHKKHHP